MANEAFRWCFIGTGTLGRQVAEEITASGRHAVASAYSRRPEQREAFTARNGGIPCADPESAIAAADGVYIVTPHTSHYDYARLALEMGKPVLCEKPFTVRAEETRALFALAREKKVYIAEAMWTWFAPPARKILEWVEQGAVGDVLDVQTVHSVNVIRYAPRLSDPMLAGGALLDTGVYPVTYLYRLFGKPSAVRCTGTIENGIDVSDEIELTFPDGSVRGIKVSIVDPANEEYIRITGTRGEIRADRFHYADRAVLTDRDGKILEDFRAKTTILNEFDRVAEEIREGRTESAWVPPQATLDVMEILDECRRQIGLVYPFEKA